MKAYPNTLTDQPETISDGSMVPAAWFLRRRLSTLDRPLVEGSFLLCRRRPVFKKYGVSVLLRTATIRAAPSDTNFLFFLRTGVPSLDDPPAAVCRPPRIVLCAPYDEFTRISNQTVLIGALLVYLFVFVSVLVIRIRRVSYARRASSPDQCCVCAFPKYGWPTQQSKTEDEDFRSSVLSSNVWSVFSPLIRTVNFICPSTRSPFVLLLIEGNLDDFAAILQACVFAFSLSSIYLSATGNASSNYN